MCVRGKHVLPHIIEGLHLSGAGKHGEACRCSAACRSTVLPQLCRKAPPPPPAFLAQDFS